MQNYPYVITVSSEKGGVGKTTLATNLAIFLKALNEDLPVSIFSFDNHFTVDKMFAIKGQTSKGSVADLLMETPGQDLLHTGQYGVNYIPSSTALNDLKGSLKGTMALARLFALSQIPGILIVDTRPDLDILTQNALYAADRVIIPVKDMPSLENCRNIFELFDKRGLDKKSLSLLPCLIDSRIKFDGPFRDQKTLLRTYAIHRGYRCFETFISKSPKVESLNTNPDGRIYPILTYARGTEVYGQFVQLAKTISEEFHGCREPRSLLFQKWLSDEDKRKNEAYSARLSGLKQECILCGRSLNPKMSSAVSFYYETSDHGASGFIEDDCYLDFIKSAIYGINQPLSSDDPASQLFRTSARESLFVFRPLTNGNNNGVEFCRFDLRGAIQTKKQFDLQNCETPEFGSMSRLIVESLGEYGGKLRDALLLVHPVNQNSPQSILTDERYREFSRLKKHVLGQFNMQN